MIHLMDFYWRLKIEDKQMYWLLMILIEYFVEWEFLRARIVRPDVECIDGVIHVIDRVLVLKGEISVSGQSEQAIFNPILMLLTACVFTLKWN